MHGFAFTVYYVSDQFIDFRPSAWKEVPEEDWGGVRD